MNEPIIPQTVGFIGFWVLWIGMLTPFFYIGIKNKNEEYLIPATAALIGTIVGAIAGIVM